MIPKYDVYKKDTTKVRRYNRRCGICGGALSRYNKNRYCWVHTMKGFELDWLKHQRCAYEASTKGRLKRMAEYRKEKERCRTSSR